MIDKTKVQRALRSPKTRKYSLRFIIAFILVGVLGFLVLPPVVKYVAVDKLSEVLHRPVAVKSVSINPYALSITVEGVEVKERGGSEPFVAFDSLYVNVQASSLFRLGPVVNEIRLDNPRIRLVRLPDGRYNFSDLVEEFLAKPKNDEPTPAFSLNNIQISGGVVELDDRLVDEKHVIGDIALALPFVSSMAYATDIFVEPHFSAALNGAPLDLKGRSKPFSQSRETEFLLALDNVQLPKYFDYSPVKLPVKFESGALDTDLKVVFRQEDGKAPKLIVSGTAIVKNLKANESSGQPLLGFRQLDVAVGSADLLGGKFAIDRVTVDAPEIGASVSREGAMNWLGLLPKASAEPAKPADQSSPSVEWSLAEARVTGGALRWKDESRPRALQASVEAIDAVVKNLDSKGSVADFEAKWKVDAGDWLKVDAFAIKEGRLDLANRRLEIGSASINGARALVRRSADGKVEWIEPPALRLAEAAQKDASAPWKVAVRKHVGEGVTVRFEDAAVSPKAVHVVEGLSFDLSNLTTEPGQAAEVKAAFKLNAKGDVAVDGKLTPAPLDANLNLNVKTVELLPLQPYFSEKLNVDITRGRVTASGNVLLRQAAGKAGEGNGFGALSGGFAGQATVGDFQAVDKLNSADFLRWKSFHLGKVDVRFGPESISIGEVALADFFARVIVSPEGKLNLFQIVREDEGAGTQPVVPVAPPAASPAVKSSKGQATAPVATAAKRVMPVKIDKITLQGGNVRFSDNFIKPNYSANLRRVGGTITGLSSESGTRANLELRGSYDDVAPVNVMAKINPLSAKPYLDLQADVKGVELTPLSAYSGKYAGYAIEKGKLSLFVKYRIEDDRLEAENRVFLDQLTFGDPVDSPDATKLPVRLAVSLLKNRNGEIDIDLPISGSLNDPEFSVGGLIVKVIVNLLVKAVTSPFALIGSMFGGGEELSSVEFAPGRAAISSDAVKRLETLAKALIDRPGVTLEIEGRADPDQDIEGVKRARIDRKVRALKREDLTKKNIESGAAEAVEVSPQEYPALLERVYREEKFPKPRNVVGLVKSLPVEEMEKLMLANSMVDEDDLRELGDRRARAVRDWLAAHEVPVERVFLLPSKVGAAETKANGDRKTGSRADFSLK